MSDLSLWGLCQEYSILHASLLIAGHDPGDFEHMAFHDIGREAKGFTAVRTALCNAVESGSIETVSTFTAEGDFGGAPYVDIQRTLISVRDLDRFTRAAGLVCPTFDRNVAGAQVGVKNRFHSKKLQAANRAWEAVTSNPGLLRGKSPKQALQSWLTAHASELALLNKEGAPNQTAIEEISKVANWKPEGGATPTPTSEAPFARRDDDEIPGLGFEPRERFAADLDDEIPF